MDVASFPRNVPPSARWAALLALTCTAPLLAADERGRVLAINTVLLAGAVGSASLLLGAPLAFLLARTDVVGRKLWTLLLLALLFTPLYLQAAAWQAAFGLQGWFTVATASPALLDGWRGAIAVHTLAAVPWVAIIVGVGLLLTNADLEEQALLDGTPSQVFRRVTLRRSANAMAAAFLWVVIATAGEITVTDLFQIRTYAEQIYTEFALGDRLDAPWKTLTSAIATAWIITAGLLLTSQLAPPDRNTPQRQRPTFRLRRWRIPLSVAIGFMVAALVGIPASSLLVKAGTIVTRHQSALVRGWSAQRFCAIVAQSPWRFSPEIGWSVLVGAMAATTAIVIGLPLAWNARRGGWRAAPAWLVIAVCLALPGPLIGLGLIACFNTPNWPWLLWLYDRSIAAIWIAQTLRALPLCTLVLWYALRTISDDLLDSAALEGAMGLTRFFRIVLPARRPAIAVAWWVALAMAWGELSASILVVPPGVMTLPIQIFGLIHYGVDDQVAGISLFIAAAFFALALLISWLVRTSDHGP